MKRKNTPDFPMAGLEKTGKHDTIYRGNFAVGVSRLECPAEAAATVTSRADAGAKVSVLR